MGTETLGNHAEHQRVGQHLVVPGEIADRQQFDTGILLQLPVLGAQAGAHLAQTGLGQFAFPVGFQRLLQFAVAANARETEVVGQCHGCLSLSVDGDILGSQTK